MGRIAAASLDAMGEESVGAHPDAEPGRCLCDSAAAYSTCCGPILSRQRPAVTAEALMRSRYSAFATGDDSYLKHSWDPDTVPESLRLDPGRHWTGLDLLRTTGGGAFDSEGTVEFRAEFSDDQGQLQALTETSAFRRFEGRWVYTGAVERRES